MTRKITFVNSPEHKRAVEIMEAASNDVLDNQPLVVLLLQSSGLLEVASEVENMSSDEYADFITNNVE